MSHECTYCPEDNKLRFYPDWADPDFDKETLKAAGYRWASKQECYVCPRWTPRAEDAALEYVDEIGDEDYSPQERAADRAERFSGYRDRRRGEAGAHADAFDAGPQVHGYQSQARADRAAARHDRQRVKAVSQWSKAEYWQQRTAGVIALSLYRSSAHVRRGRVKDLESQIRCIEANYTPNPKIAQSTQHHRNAEYDYATRTYDREPEPHVYCGSGRGGQWVAVADLPKIEAAYSRTLAHLRMRLIYERGMLENEGGMAGEVEMIPGGFVRIRGAWLQIHGVNKSPATGRITSVKVLTCNEPWGRVRTNDKGEPVYFLASRKVERLGEDCYRAPTAEELEDFEQRTKAAKAKKKATAPKKPSLVNPTDEDAERLQTAWNERARQRHAKANQYSEFKPSSVLRITQAQYSANSKGDYSSLSTVDVGEKLVPWRESRQRKVIFKVRRGNSGQGSFYAADRVIVITDKPQKPIPWDAAAEFLESQPTFNGMLPRIEEIAHALAQGWQRTDEQAEILEDAAYAGICCRSASATFQWSEEGAEAYREHLDAKRAELSTV